MTAWLRASVSPLAFVAVGIGLACEPIVEDPIPTAPSNSCPANPCDAYNQSGPAPSCNQGVCTVAAPMADLLLLIGLPTDSYQAPGRTYLTTLNASSPASGTCTAPTCCTLQDCRPPACGLYQWTTDQSEYLIDPHAAGLASWDVDNPGTYTSLPVQATFRQLFGDPLQDALDLGLPVEPVQAVNTTTPQGNPGPDHTLGTEFKAYMPPGCYERTLQPFFPFSTAFPPEIKIWPPDQAVTDAFDLTTEEGLASGAQVTPKFDIARAEGLGGWTAYLRNIHTRRIFSNVASLTGSLAQGVTLLTNHEPGPRFDALTDLELVVAPPAGTPLPTYVVAPIAQEVAASEVYPSLPTPVTMTGRIRTAAGTPVPAEVYFTAANITDRSGQPFPPNFEFTAHVSTSTDPQTGAATYVALLPRGDYQIAVRPRGDSPISVRPPDGHLRPMGGTSAVTIVTRTVGGQGNVMAGVDLDVVALVSVFGRALVADGRPLAEAVAEVVPTNCAASSDPVVAATDPSNPCLPRAAQTLTADDGSFALDVDPGQYLVRIRPRDGSRLPWTIQPIVVGTTSVDVKTILVPAPISVGMKLTDTTPTFSPLINALVRVFTDPSKGSPAVELGEAITDTDGNYEMYLAPLAQ